MDDDVTAGKPLHDGRVGDVDESPLHRVIDTAVAIEGQHAAYLRTRRQLSEDGGPNAAGCTGDGDGEAGRGTPGVPPHAPRANPGLVVVHLGLPCGYGGIDETRVASKFTNARQP